MSDFTGELCVLGAALVSPLATNPAAHAFLASAGATPAAAAVDGSMKGTFACPWIPPDSPLGARLSVLAVQAVTALLDALPESLRARADIEIVVVVPGAEQGITGDDVWMVERSVRTVLHGTRATLTPLLGSPRGSRAYLDELLRAGWDLSQETLRLLVAVDSPAHPERAPRSPEGHDSPWDPAPVRRSEAASGLLLGTAARAARDRLPIWGRLRGGATRVHDSTPDNDVPSDGSALTEAIRALPGRSPFAMVAGPEPLSGFFRSELSIAAARDFERFQPAYHPLRPASLLGDVGIASLPAAVALALATLRHGTAPRGEELSGTVLVWDLFPDGTRVALALEASLDPPPPHRAARTLAPMTLAAPPAAKKTRTAPLTEPEQGCLERLLALCRLRKEAPWRELPHIEQRILANLDALAEAGAALEGVSHFFARRGDPLGGEAAALTLGALGQPGTDGAALFEEALVALFGEDGTVRIEAGDSTLDALWLAAEGLFLCPFFLTDPALRRWIDDGPPIAAAIALVALARRRVDPGESARRRLRAGEPLFAAATARAASFLPDLGPPPESWRALLDGPGPLAWEGARALLLMGDETPLLRLRAGDELGDRLGEQALSLLALVGHAGDSALFARTARRLPRTPTVLQATGYFGSISLAGLLLSALDDQATAAAGAAALETMLGPVPEGSQRSSRAAWVRAVEQATWAASVRARDGVPWSLEEIVRPKDAGRLSDREWQFRIDEVRFGGKRAVLAEPGGFGSTARQAMLAAIDGDKRGRG